MCLSPHVTNGDKVGQHCPSWSVEKQLMRFDFGNKMVMKLCERRQSFLSLNTIVFFFYNKQQKTILVLWFRLFYLSKQEFKDVQ